MEMIVMNYDNDIFVANKPSVLYLYIDEVLSNGVLIKRLINNHSFDSLEVIQTNNDIVKVRVLYKEVYFNIFLKVDYNENLKLENIASVLVDDKDIEKAVHTNIVIKSFLDTKHEFVKAYYAQLKLLNCISTEPLLVLDNNQLCIYSKEYLAQFGSLNIDIVDSNLFKIRYDSHNTLYTTGLDRFGIKDFFIVRTLKSSYIKEVSDFMSRLARYFIENGQLINSCKKYPDIFETNYYACLIETKKVKKLLYDYKLVNKDNKNIIDADNYLYLSLHSNNNVDDYIISDEEVLDYLGSNKIYYSSDAFFNCEKELAQQTLNKIVEFLENIEDQHNLMILARNEKINTDWYHYVSSENNIITIKNMERTLEVVLDDVIDWNYQGFAPLTAYALLKKLDATN
jgi:hypothetical protein